MPDTMIGYARCSTD
ncbi:hypothetical protein, partial [Phytoactinopolyspora endophytica]